MVTLRRYREIGEFARATAPALCAREVENNLPIGLLDRMAGGETDPEWFMATATGEGGAMLLFALMTPPHNLIVAALTPDPGRGAYEALAAHLVAEAIAPRGVLAERPVARAFAVAYEAVGGRKGVLCMTERLYRLDRVADVQTVGALRPVRPGDEHFLPYWLGAFEEDCFGGHVALPDQWADVTRMVERGHAVLEVDGQPVTLVGGTRKTPHGHSVGSVYTPPYFRGKGYATSAVAMFSQSLLDRGFAHCALFADLSNPASNRVYQKIGYRAVCEFEDIRFD